MSPIEITYQDKIIHVPPLDVPLETRGLGYAVFFSMFKRREEIAQIDGTTNETDTYGYLFEKCVRTAITMKSIGITSNDIVTICSRNHLNSIVPYFAALFIGAKVSALEPFFTVKDTTHLLKEVTPKLIFVSPECIQLVEAALKEVTENVEVVVFGKTEKYIGFSEFLLPNEEEEQFEPVEIENLFETAIIFFSSGISGLPKGICLNHYAILGQTLHCINYGFCVDKTFTISSLYWTVTVCYILMIVFTGSTQILLPVPLDYDQMCSAISKYKPTTIVGVGSAFLYELACYVPKHIDVSSIKQLAPGGTPLIKGQLLKVKKTFFNGNLVCGYGQTEMFMGILIFKPNDEEDNALLIKKPTSCGRPLPGFSYIVVDPDTEEILGPNQPGELRLKTKFALNGYYNRDSSHIWDENGWYKTGDIVYYDDEFCFYIVDQTSEMLKYQNWNVEPAALEMILKSHPAIDYAVVIGIPHELDGDHPMAIVVLKESSTRITPEDIKQFVDGKVDDVKKLRGGVKIVDFIPTTTTGRMDRRNIRNMVLEGKL